MKDFINHPKVELEAEEIDIIERAIDLFGEIAEESHSQGPAFKTLELAADKVAEYLINFAETFVENS